MGQANVYRRLGDISSALAYFNHVSKTAEKFGNIVCQVSALQGLGSIYLYQKHDDSALACYEKALRLSRSLSNKELMQSSLNGAAMAFQGMGRNEEAQTKFNRSLLLAKEMNDVPKIMDALNHLGLCYRNLADYPRGISAFLEVLSMSSILNLRFPEKNLRAHYGIGSIYQRQGKILQAIRHYRSGYSGK